MRPYGQRTYGIAQRPSCFARCCRSAYVANPCKPYETYVDLGFNNPIEGFWLDAPKRLYISMPPLTPHT